LGLLALKNVRLLMFLGIGKSLDWPLEIIRKNTYNLYVLMRSIFWRWIRPIPSS